MAKLLSRACQVAKLKGTAPAMISRSSAGRWRAAPMVPRSFVMPVF
jgi:hypothetical protein